MTVNLLMPDSVQKPLRILLADDHPFVREGIRSFLAEVNDIEVVGEARTGAEVLDMASGLQPDLLLLDINLPDMNGIETLRRLTSQSPGIRVLVLSVHNTREYVIQGAKAGARGYILKDAPPEELLQAIRSIQNGNHYYSPAVARYIVEHLQPPSAPGENRPPLSERELEVLVLIAQGKTIKEMADALNITPSSAQTYRARLMEKLQIHTVAGLTRYALLNKIIPFE